MTIGIVMLGPDQVVTYQGTNGYAPASEEPNVFLVG